MAKSTTRAVLDMSSSTLRLFLNIVIYSVLIVLVYKYAWQAYSFSFRIFGSDPVEDREVTDGKDIKIIVEEGDNALKIGAKLTLNKAIHDKYSFYIRARLMKAQFYPGEFTVNTTMDYDEMFAVFKKGATQETHDPEDDYLYDY